MASQTHNIHLKKPDYGESADVEVFNENMDSIDDAIGPVAKFVPGLLGARDQVLRNNGDGTTRWDNAASNDEIVTAVNNWLDGHIVQNPNVIIDNTLSISGAAADAKVTGNLMERVQEDLYGERSVDTKSITPAATASAGGCQGTVGNTMTTTSSSSYHYQYYNIDGFEDISFTVTTQQSTSANYPKYIFFVNDSLKIIAVYGESVGSTQTKTYSNLTIPAGATKLYVMTYGLAGNISVTKKYYKPSDTGYVARVDALEDDVDDIQETLANMDYDTQIDAIEDDIEVIQLDVDALEDTVYGTPPVITVTPTPAAAASTGGCRGGVGETISFSTSSSYHYLYYNISHDDISFTVTTEVTDTAYYPNWVHFVNDSGKILKVCAYTSATTQSHTFSDVTIPTGATKVYVTTYSVVDYISVTKKCYGVDPNALIGRIEQLEENTIEGLDELYDDVQEIKEVVGDLEYVMRTMPYDSSLAITGGLTGTIGNQLTRTTTTAYQNITIPLDEDAITLTIRTQQSNSTQYPKYAWFLNSSGVILSTVGSLVETQQICTYENVEIPTGATQIAVLTIGLIGNVVVKKKIIKSISVELEGIDRYLYKNGISLSPYATPMKDAARKTAFQHNYTKKYLNFAFITDTHFGGTRYPEYEARNNIRTFVEMSNERWVDFAAHGGDMITDYGLTRDDAITWFDDTLGIMGDIQVPLFVAKGNHEANNAYYEPVADMTHLDWNSNTYYVRSDIQFTTVTQAQWDGTSQLYTADFADERIPDHQFTMLAQLGFAGDVVRNANDPMGGYFYKDFDREKVRVIVLNEYQIQGTTFKNITAQQIAWFGGTALDLTGKTDYHVMVISHSQNGNSSIFNLINGFRTGANVTISGTTYRFADQGAKPFIMYLHGHEHVDTLVTSSGFNNVGVACGFVPVETVDTPDEFCFSIFTIDTDERIVYETRIGRGNNRSIGY